MSQIKITDLSFSYLSGGEYIFQNLNLVLDTDWKLALIGRNGKGKTTFLKLLMNEYEYSGKISASVDFSYFPINVPNENLSCESIAVNIAGDYEPWCLKRELGLLSLSEEILLRPYNTLSKGEQTKFLIACMFVMPKGFLLIDEPLNHLDYIGRKVLSEYLNTKKGYIIVSHDRAFIDACSDHVLSINRSGIDLFKGNYTTWETENNIRNEAEKSENEKLVKEITRLNDSMYQKEKWADKLEKTKHERTSAGLRPDRGHVGRQSAKMMRRAKAVEARKEKAVSEKQKLLKNTERTEKLIIRPTEFYKNTLVIANGLSLFYGEKCVVNDISFCVNRGDRVCIAGKNGSGKTTLLKHLLFENIEHTGEFSANKKAVISYLPQAFSGLSGSLYDIADNNAVERTVFFTNLAQLGLDSSLFDNDTAAFSLGQKKKVLLSLSMSKPADLYVWDEPLNYIDIISRGQIEEMLLSYCPTMIFVEHDADFCKKIATKYIEL